MTCYERSTSLTGQRIFIELLNLTIKGLLIGAAFCDMDVRTFFQVTSNKRERLLLLLLLLYHQVTM